MRKTYTQNIFTKEENSVFLDTAGKNGLDFLNGKLQNLLMELSTCEAEIYIEDCSLFIKSKKYGELSSGYTDVLANTI